MITALFAFLSRATSAVSRLARAAAVRLEWLAIRRGIRATPELRELSDIFRRAPESGWTVASDDALRLFRLVLRLQPERILELGTGIGFSAAVMAAALERTGRGRITSLEQLPKCIDIAGTLIPPRLLRRVEIIHAPPEVFRIERLSRWIYFCGYRWTPQPGDRFGLVVVDGPAGWVESGELVSLDSGDIFRLLPSILPGGMVYVDGRRATVKRIKRYLRRYLRFTEGTSEYAIFVRTDASASASDAVPFTDAKQSGRPETA